MSTMLQHQQAKIAKNRQAPAESTLPMSFMEQDRLMKERRRVKQLSNREALERQMEEKKLLRELDHDFSLKRREGQFATSIKMIKAAEQQRVPMKVEQISQEAYERE